MNHRISLSLTFLLLASIGLLGGAIGSHAAGTGLVAAYSFDATSGATLVDASGNGNDGTLSGATWASSGKHGGALTFDGAGDLVSVPDSASLDLTSGMTIEAWVRPTQLGSMWRTVAVKSAGSHLAYALYAHDGNPGPSGHVYTGADKFVSSGSFVSTTAWTHLATTYNGTTLTLYVDGSPVGSQTIGSPISVSNGA